MPPSKLPSPSKKISEQKERNVLPAVPWSPAECHQLTESLLTLTPTRVRYPPLPHPTERDIIQSSIAASAGRSAVVNPSTPLSNTSKRRNAIAKLSRTIPHQSHGVRMAQIFQDAADEIQKSSKGATTSGSTPANTKRSRIPFPSARGQPLARTRNREQEALVSPTRRLGASRASPTNSELINDFPTPPLPRVTAPPAAASRAGREPISSGFSSPTKSPVRRTCHSIADTPASPCANNGLKNVSPSNPFEDPAASPPTPCRVDDWLNGVLDIPPILCTPIAITASNQPVSTNRPNRPVATHLSPTLPNLKHSISLTSDKENVPPSTIALSWSSIASSSPRTLLPPTASQSRSKETRAQRKKTPLRPPQRKASTSSSSFSIRGLPRRRIARTPAQVFEPSDKAPLGLLSLAPIRKKLKSTHSGSTSGDSLRLEGSPDSRTISDQGSLVGKENMTPFEIFSEFEEGSHDRVTSLSPRVEVFRKGRGPRRERSRSYWDEDILGMENAEVDQGEVRGGASRKVREVFGFSSEKGFTKRVILGELGEGQV